MRLNYATISSVTGAGWTSFRPDHLLRRAALDAEPLPTSPHMPASVRWHTHTLALDAEPLPTSPHMPASVRWHTHTLALDAEPLPVSPRIGVPEEPSEAPLDAGDDTHLSPHLPHLPPHSLPP